MTNTAYGRRRPVRRRRGTADGRSDRGHHRGLPGIRRAAERPAGHARVSTAPHPLSHLAYRVPEWDQYAHVRSLLERHAVASVENVVGTALGLVESNPTGTTGPALVAEIGPRAGGPLRRFCLALVAQRLEGEADPLRQYRRRRRLVCAGSHHPDVVAAAHPAVTPEIALLLVQRPQPLHGPKP